MITLPDGTKITNNTREAVRFIDAENDICVTIHPEVETAFVTPVYIPIEGKQYLTLTRWQEGKGFPAKVSGVYRIVTKTVKLACPDRDDFVIPSDIIRDSQGSTVSCRRFSR